MDSPKTQDEKLQMFFDGELGPEEEASVRGSLEDSPEGTAQLREWERLRTAMKGVASDWAGDLDSEGRCAGIENGIAAEAQPAEQPKPQQAAPPALRVVPGGRERRVWGGVATGFAAAAAIFLAVKATMGLRVSEEEELEGLDFGEHGMHAYDLHTSRSQFDDALVGQSLRPTATPSLATAN